MPQVNDVSWNSISIIFFVSILILFLGTLIMPSPYVGFSRENKNRLIFDPFCF